MANKKGKKGGNKQKKAQKPKTAGKTIFRTSPSIKMTLKHPSRGQHVAAACSITDPFCVHAKAARRPDGLSTNSMPYQVRTMELITTSSTGGARSFFASGFGLYCRAVATLAGGNWTLPATFEDTGVSKTFLDNNANEIRIVSYGLIIRSIVSATTSSGLVVVGSTGYLAPAMVFPEGQITFDESHIQSLAPGMELSWISKPIGTDAHNFKDAAAWSPIAPNAYHDWTSASIEVIGGPNSTAVLSVEVFVNVEFTIATTTGMSSMMPPSKPANALAIKAQQAVHSTVPAIIEGGVEKVGKFLESKAAGAVDDFLSGAMAFLGL